MLSVGWKHKSQRKIVNHHTNTDGQTDTGRVVGLAAEEGKRKRKEIKRKLQANGSGK